MLVWYVGVRKDKLKFEGGFIVAIQKKSLNSTSRSANKVKVSASNSVARKGTARGTKAVNLKTAVYKLPAVQ